MMIILLSETKFKDGIKYMTLSLQTFAGNRRYEALVHYDIGQDSKFISQF